MNFNKYIKVVFVFLIGTIFTNVLDAQSIGINSRVYKLRSTFGMPDYENRDRTPGWTRPDLNFLIYPSAIWANGQNLSGLPTVTIPGGGIYNPNYTRRFFYENRHPHHDIYPGTGGLGDEDFEHGTTIISRNFSPQRLIDLGNRWSIQTLLGFEANEDDRPFQFGFGGDDDYRFLVPYKWVPLSYVASKGDQPYDRNISNAGYTATHGTTTYPYYVTTRSSYTIDPIHPNLQLLNPDGTPGFTFCAGLPLKVRANYKTNFTGGKFYWEVDVNGDNNWQFLKTSESNVIDDYARKSTTRYRTRVMSTWSTYGVPDFNEPQGTGMGIANSAVGAMLVQEVFNGFTFEKRDACPGAQGSATLTNIIGATDGMDYIINFFDGVAIIQRDTILNYSSTTLANQNIIFTNDPGDYAIQVLNLIPEFKCGIKRSFTIDDSVFPEFEASKRDPFCFGENGVITFSNINFKNTTGPFQHTITAEKSTGEIFTNSITELTGTISVPPGTYTLSAENIDGCTSQDTYTATLTPKTELLASMTPPTTHQTNGIDYHGYCREDKFDIAVNINGGIKPYKIILEKVGSPDIMYQLLESDSTFVLPEVGHGDYTVKVFDAYACEISPMPFIINNPTKVEFINLISNNPTVGCGAPNGDGVITSGVTGGIPPYTLYFDGQVVTAIDSTTLRNGTYMIKVVDDNGCEDSKTITLFDTQFMTMSDNGTVLYDVVPCGGTNNFRIFVNNGYLNDWMGSWSFKMNGIECVDNPNCQVAPGLYQQDYGSGLPLYQTYFDISVDNTSEQKFEVTDDSGCTLYSTYQFDSPFIPEVGSITNVPPACIGDDYQVTFYLQDVNESVFGNSAPINYELDGINGSVNFNTEDGTNGTPPLIPYQFTIPITNPGDHAIEVSDYLNCSTTTAFDFNLMPMDTFKLDIVDINHVNCQGDSTGSVIVELEGNPPFTISYSNYPVDFDTLDYPNVVPIRDTLIITDLIATIPNLANNEYYISASNANNCTILDQYVYIQNPTDMTAMLSTSSSINCTGNNGIIEVTNITGGTPPYRIALNDQTFQTGTTLNGAKLENTVIIKDAEGCTLTLTQSIPSAPQTLFSTLTAFQGSTECAAGSAILDIPAGFMEPLLVQKIENPNSANVIQLQNYGTVVAIQDYRDTIYELDLGMHYFVLQDGLGCELIDSVEILMADTLTAAVTLNQFETCYQQSADGALEITCSGGQAPYRITIDGETYDTVATVASYTDLSYGYYYIYIEDAAGCVFNINDSIVAGSLPLASFVTNDLIGCSNDSLMADISMTGYNGTAPFTFAWDDSTTTAQKIVVTPNEYNVTVTDADGCWTRENIIVLGPDTLNIGIKTITDAVCHADNNGSIAVTAHGGFTPYSFSIDGGATYQTDSTFTGLTIGDYEIFISDDHGCLDTVLASISFTNALSANILVEQVTCNGENSGGIQANLLGGIAPFSYSLDDMNYQPANVFTNLAPGTYDIYIQDGSGCKAAYFGNEITEPSAIVVSTSLTNDEACGQMNGAASGMASGGTPPLTYEWDGDPTLNSLILTNVAAGLHTFVVTDANGCNLSSSVTINNLAAPAISLLTSNDEICGNSNGSISVQISNGTAPMSFTWSHDSNLNGPTATNLIAGTYSVTITDTNNCTDIFSTTINEISGPTLSLVSKSNSLCTDDNGSISLQTTNGTGPMTYLWSHDAALNAATATGLPSGTYSAMVTDSNGCQDDLTISIDFDAPPVIGNPTINQETCSDANGTITIPVSGGTTPYQFAWSHDPTLNAAAAIDLTGGSYSVTVTDALGCTAELLNINVNAAAPPVLTIDSFVNADCLNPLGSVTLETTNGLAPFTYAWSHDPNATGVTISDLMSGTYTATVTDANGCTASVSQSLISFVGSSTITNTLECFGDSDGSIEITLEGNLNDYTYAWSDPSILTGPTASNLSTGTYTVTVTNMNGCMEMYSETIIDPEQIIPTISDVIPVGCFGNLGSAIASPTGGDGNYSYSWDDANAQSSATASNLPIGTFTVTVTDGLGCNNSESITIEQSLPIVITEGIKIEPTCFGESNGSIAVTASDGFGNLIYNWSNTANTNTISAITAGDYSLTVTDEVGCTAMTTISLSEPDELTASAVMVQAILCNGDANGQVIANPLGGTAPYGFEWNDMGTQTTQTAMMLSTGDYQVTVTDDHLCQSIASISVDEPEALALSDVITESPNCTGEENGSIEVIVTGGTGNYNYNWNAGALVNNSLIENLGAGLYDLEVLDQNNCSLAESIDLIDPDPLQINTANVIDAICSNAPSGAIEIIAEGGDGNLVFDWSNGSSNSSIQSLSTGTYVLTITDGKNCELIDSFDITSSQVDFINLGGADSVVCLGSALFYDFSTAPFDFFQWSSLSNGDLSTEASFLISEPDVYYLTAENTDGCITQDTINVSVISANLDAFFIAPTDIVVGDTLVAVELTLPIPDEVNWSYDSTAIELVGQEGNQYFFHFTSIGEFELLLESRVGGCYSEIAKTIFVYENESEIPFINPLVPLFTDIRLFPNPNNGIFTLEVDLSLEKDMVIDIFNSQSLLFDRSIFEGGKKYSKGYNLDLATGIYYAIIQVEGERRSITLVVE